MNKELRLMFNMDVEEALTDALSHWHDHLPGLSEGDIDLAVKAACDSMINTQKERDNNDG